jgi:hypothetical protein
MTLETTKDAVDIVQSVAATLAIVVGAYWALRRFGLERPLMRRADVSQQIQVIDLPPACRLLHVTLQVKNVGTIVLRPSKADCLVQRISPMDAAVQDQVNRYIREPESDRGAYRGDGNQLYYADGGEIRWPALERRQFADVAEGGEVDAGETERWDLDFVLPRGIGVVGVFTEVSLDEKHELWWSAYSLLDMAAPPKP